MVAEVISGRLEHLQHPMEMVKAMAKQILLGLDLLHKSGVVHTGNYVSRLLENPSSTVVKFKLIL